MTNNTNDARTNPTISLDCKGPNKACKAAHKAGRPVHIIPALIADRGLVLPTYHFATEEEARAYLDAARITAPVVHSDLDLVMYRHAGIPHRLPEGWIDPTRR